VVGVAISGRVGVVNGSVVGGNVGTVTGRVTVDFGTGTPLDKLVTVVAEPGDTVRVDRDGREVFRLDALPGVVVEVTARLPRLGSGAPPEPPESGAKERVGGLADASASGGKKS
jgi:hypothetical protein